MGKSHFLSKSRMMVGLGCQKALWLQINQKNLARETTPAEQARMDTGHEVGREAQKKFPGGVLIDKPYWDITGALDATAQALQNGATTIFEASFAFEGIYARIDILKKVGNAWELIEVKSTTSVKEEHYLDVALQKWILDQLGMPVSKAYLMHLNNQCVFPNLKNLFTKVDITDEVDSITPYIEDEIPGLKAVLQLSKAPNVDIGPHCAGPYECAFKEHCWTQKKIPRYSVFDLPGMGQKAWEHYHNGLINIKDLIDVKLSATQRRAVEATIRDQIYIDHDAIQEELSKWQYPLYYLDFETIAFAIPKYPGTRPYQALPFQYSLHVQQKPNGPLEHFEFLNTKDQDPREALAKHLIKHIGKKGSVVAYNKRFEVSCIKGLAEAFPEYESQLLSMNERMVDPMSLFKRFVYHREFLGSFGLKSVAPVLLGDELSYDELEVSDGDLAQAAYKQMIALPNGDPTKQKIIADMIKYCTQDTLAMVKLVGWMYLCED